MNDRLVTGLLSGTMLGSLENMLVASSRIYNACDSLSLPSRKKWLFRNSWFTFRSCPSNMKNSSSVGLVAAGGDTYRVCAHANGIDQLPSMSDGEGDSERTCGTGRALKSRLACGVSGGGGCGGCEFWSGFW